MAEDDETPRLGKPREKTARPADRDVLVPKHSGATNPFGWPLVPSMPPVPAVVRDDMTPPPIEAPDPVEIAAMRVESRAVAIERRPGPTPSPASMQVALTVHALQATFTLQITELKQYIATTLLEEVRRDREAERQAEAQQRTDRAKWSELWRTVLIRIVIGIGIVGTTILATLRAAGKI